MPTTQTLQPLVHAGQGSAHSDQGIYAALDQPRKAEKFLSAYRGTLVEAPTFVQVYLSGRSGFGAHGLLKSISRGGLQVLVPVSVPVRTAVQVTVSGCEPVLADVFYCVKKSTVYQTGIVLRARPKPEVAIGGLAVMNELDEPFTVSRGHIVDIGRDSISMLCKTAIRPEAWVRLESDGWVLFGEVKAVVPTSMMATCVAVHLDAAFRSRSSAGLGTAQSAGEGGLEGSSHGF
jgi:hypothetical protein